MNHFSKVFDRRKQRKSMDQTTSSSSSPKPKLLRRYAAKHFEYNPLASSSSSSSTSPSTSTSGSSSSQRTRSLDLPRNLDQTSFRVRGNNDVDTIFRSLELSGPEAFEISKADWEALKNNRSFSDVVAFAKKDHFDFDLDMVEKTQKEEEVKQFVETPPHRIESNAQINDEIEVNDAENQLKQHGQSDVGFVGKVGGIKGDRPPLLLRPPPVMSVRVHDDGCSTWDLLKRFAPDGDKHSCFPDHGMSHIGDDDEGNGAHREGHYGVRIGETSGCCSFTTNDDDSSSTTTERVSIISPDSGCRLNITHITHWEKGALKGKGSFGTVYEGISGEGFFFAVKEVSLLEQGSQGRQSIDQLEQEIELLSQFEHENIVRYLGTDKDESNLYIFLELMTQGSLASNYRKYTFRDSHVSAYTRQILLGLKYLHEKNVVHRDIKCANILVASNGTVKLADFGLAKATTRLNDLKSCKGTPFWMAPEVVYNKNQGYGFAADIWSLGCSVLEMITRNVPYYPLDFVQAIYRIGKGEPPPIPEKLSRDTRDFIQQCLRVDPNDRPTASELLEHPFVRRQYSGQIGSESPMLPGRSL